jgi:anti-sigma factor RsiW
VDEPRAGAGCPDPEEMAAYLDRRVEPDRRSIMQTHIADCDDCREWLAESVRAHVVRPA